MEPKTNEDYMREIRNIQPAHPLVYERIEQILTEKDKQREEAVAEARKKIIEKVEAIIAEFGDQGMKCVAVILQESFHGQKEVEY